MKLNGGTGETGGNGDLRAASIAVARAAHLGVANALEDSQRATAAATAAVAATRSVFDGAIDAVVGGFQRASTAHADAIAKVATALSAVEVQRGRSAEETAAQIERVAVAARALHDALPRELAAPLVDQIARALDEVRTALERPQPAPSVRVDAPVNVDLGPLVAAVEAASSSIAAEIRSRKPKRIVLDRASGKTVMTIEYE